MNSIVIYFTHLSKRRLPLPKTVTVNSTLSKLQGKLSATTMRVWQQDSYGDLTKLHCSTTSEPELKDPHELLIKVEAASVNPIDLLMLEGYGKTLFKLPRKFSSMLPLTLGRDFCGSVLNKGKSVDDSISIGDKVYGFVPIDRQGSFAEVIVANQSQICKQPEHLTAVECTSLVYATMTAWAALFVNSGHKITAGTRILILGISGGVGTAALQLLKSQDCVVFGTCSTDAVPLVKSLGADRVFDYKDENHLNDIANEGHYDIVLDCAQFGFDKTPKTWKFDTFVSLNSPLLKNADNYGLVGGLTLSGCTLLKNRVQSLFSGKGNKWGFFTPSAAGFQFIDKIIKEKKMRPIIHKEFKFDDLHDAFKELSAGHIRGKVVINYNKQ